MNRPFPACAPRLPKATRSSRLGFTLVELLVVITIIGMLAALLVAAVTRAREAGRRATCLNNQQNIGKAILGFVTAKERFPNSFSAQPNWISGTSQSPAFVGWVPPLLPYLELNPLHQIYQQNSWNGGVATSPLPLATNSTTTYVAPVLICPSRNPTNTPAPLSYVVNCGAPDSNNTSPPAGAKTDWQANGVFFNSFNPGGSYPSSFFERPFDLTFLSRKDGAALTLMFSESTNALDWAWSPNQNYTNKSITDYSSGTNFGRCWWQGIIWDVPAGAPFSTAADPTLTTGLTPVPRLLNQNRGLDIDAATNLSSVATVPSGIGGDLGGDLAFARPASEHPGGFIATMCDGHSQFMSEDIEYRVYVLLMTPDSAGALMPGQQPVVSGSPNLVPFPNNTVWRTQMNGPLIPLTAADLDK